MKKKLIYLIAGLIFFVMYSVFGTVTYAGTAAAYVVTDAQADYDYCLNQAWGLGQNDKKFLRNFFDPNDDPKPKPKKKFVTLKVEKKK
jgi:hypothetical protein